MQNWAIWIVFGVILAALIGFLVFSFVRDKRKNMKITQKRMELKRETIKASKKLAIRIYTLVELIQQWLTEVKPGSSKLKMRHVNAIARIFLKNIYDSKEFKIIYIDSEEADPDYARNLKMLIDHNSNMWSKYCAKEIEYFKKFYDELKDDKDFNEIKEDATKIITEIYNEEIKK